MNKGFITSLIIILSFLSVLADRKMTIHNTETGESFEVSVPDGLKIFEYNSNWLDSIPYLQEHARCKEPWAYKAIGDCFRYGRGVEESMFNAILFYEKYDKDIKTIIQEDSLNDTKGLNEFCNYFEDILHNEVSRQLVLSKLDNLKKPHPAWATQLSRILGLSTEETLELMMNPEVSPDNVLFGLMNLRLNSGNNMMDSIYNDTLRIKAIICNIGSKLPSLADPVTEVLWAFYNKNKENNPLMGQLALTLSYHADRWGLLSTDNMINILSFCEENPTYQDLPFNSEDIKRFRINAKYKE